MKKTWIIILSTILAIVVVLQIAVMVFLNSTGIHIISKYARFNTGGKGYVYNTVTKEWERENISWYIDLLVRNKKADGVLSVEDYGKLTGNRPVISVDMSKDFCKIFFSTTVTKYNKNGGIEDISTIVLYRFIYNRKTGQIIIEIWDEEAGIKYLVNADTKEDAEIILNSYMKKLSDQTNGE